MSDKKHEVLGGYIEKIMALSTAHMPNTNPEFGDVRVLSYEYGYMVFVTDCSGEGLDESFPNWFRPIMELADRQDCTLIMFDEACNVDPDLQTWDW